MVYFQSGLWFPTLPTMRFNYLLLEVMVGYTGFMMGFNTAVLHQGNCA